MYIRDVFNGLVNKGVIDAGRFKEWFPHFEELNRYILQHMEEIEAAAKKAGIAK